MALYSYKAATGSGSIFASSDKEAKFLLRQKGLILTELKIASSASVSLKSTELIAFTQQLAHLLEAEVPAYEALLTLSQQADSQRARQIFSELAEAIKQGNNLAAALKSYPQSFDAAYCCVVQAGLESGLLAKNLSDLAISLRQKAKVAGQIRSALIYPGLLTGFSAFVVTLLLAVIVPQMKEALPNTDKLNALSRFVFSLSDFLASWGLMLAAALVSALAALIYKARTIEGKKAIDKVLLNLPVFGLLRTKAALARFCRTLSQLLASGLPLYNALAVSRGVLKSQSLEAVFASAERRIAQGHALSSECKKSPLLPPLFARMVAIGEETGKLGVLFSKIADSYEDDVESALQRMLALLAPCILLVMGFVMMLIVLAVMIPLMDISSIGT